MISPNEPTSPPTLLRAPEQHPACEVFETGKSIRFLRNNKPCPLGVAVEISKRGIKSNIMKTLPDSHTSLAASSPSPCNISTPPGQAPDAKPHHATGPTAACAPKEPAREKLPKLLDAGIGIFACARCCGAWSPMIQTGGKMPRGYRKCPYCGQLHARQ